MRAKVLLSAALTTKVSLKTVKLEDRDHVVLKRASGA
jgi:hypothetical protein